MNGLVHKHLHNKKYDQIAHVDQSFWQVFLERTTLAAGILGPIMVVPQIYEIYSKRTAAGVSAFSWFAFAVLDVPFIIYGSVHKDKPIIITYSLFFVANIIVAIGAVLY